MPNAAVAKAAEDAAQLLARRLKAPAKKRGE